MRSTVPVGGGRSPQTFAKHIMTYYYIFLIVLFAIIFFSNTNAGSPFLSDQVKEICSHMTKRERRTAMKRSALRGLLIGIIPGAIGLILGPLILSSALVGVMLCALLFPLIALLTWKVWFPRISRSQQSFYASTEWARSQGIEAKGIQVFSFSKQK